MVTRRMVLTAAFAAGASGLVLGQTPASSSGVLLDSRRHVAAAAPREYEIFTGPFPVDDQFEVTYYYLEEHDDGFISAKGELRNHGLQPARPNILVIHLVGEDGVAWDSDLQDDIEDIVLPGETTPFWAFWSQDHPLSDLGSVRFERGADAASRSMEAPPVAFEGTEGDTLIPDEDRVVGSLRNSGETLLNVGYKVAYYSPEDIVLWIETRFKEPVPPGGTSPVRVAGRDSVRSSDKAPTLAGLSVDPDDAITYRVFAFVE